MKADDLIKHLEDELAREDLPSDDRAVYQACLRLINMVNKKESNDQ